MNSVMKPKVKGVISIQMLKLLVEKLQVVPNYLTYKSIILLGFLDFLGWHLLCPQMFKNLTPLGFLWYVIIIFTLNGMQIILKCAKNMQARDAYRIIHVPKLQSLEICPVLAIKRMLTYVKSQQTDPFFCAGY